MEDIFSSNSANIIQKTIDLSLASHVDSKTMENIDYYFDIVQITEWISKNEYKKTALQFPDELLGNAIKVSARLKEMCPANRLFILADTSYGSCCVDAVAAEHYEADSLVHFGHSCLSPVDKIPVYYAFEKHPLDLSTVQTEINDLVSANNPNQKLVVLYDVEYAYLYESLCKLFEQNHRVLISKITMSSNHHLEQSLPTRTLFSRLLPDDLKNDVNSHSFLYIGNRDSFLSPFLFYLNKNTFHKLNTSEKPLKIEPILFTKTNRDLMRRFYLIEKARDAKIFGILIGTMSVANYREAIDHVSQILKKADRRFYSFLIGKLNCPKLNNFMEVDMYVMVACNENSLINSKELNKPIVTVYELEMAFNAARMWGQEFVCDFRQLLPGAEHHMPLKLSEQESDVSLITGGSRHMAVYSGEDDNGNVRKNNTLSTRDDGLSMIHYAAAGEFLKNRSWTGLEQDLGQTEVQMAVEGKMGIAAGYVNEPKQH